MGGKEEHLSLGRAGFIRVPGESHARLVQAKWSVEAVLIEQYNEIVLGHLRSKTALHRPWPPQLPKCFRDAS